MKDGKLQVKSNENPEEVRIKARRCVEMANQAGDPDLADALMGWAHTLFRLADTIERGGREQEKRH